MANIYYIEKEKERESDEQCTATMRTIPFTRVCFSVISRQIAFVYCACYVSVHTKQPLRVLFICLNLFLNSQQREFIDSILNTGRGFLTINILLWGNACVNNSWLFEHFNRLKVKWMGLAMEWQLYMENGLVSQPMLLVIGVFVIQHPNQLNVQT